MRLSPRLIEELIKEIAGNDTVKLVGLLRNKKNISEFKLAEKLRLTVNNVRNMLYRLQDHNLVASVRKKDRKKGWYIYYWTFNPVQARTLILSLKKRRLNVLKSRLNIEKGETFYSCPNNCITIRLESAMEHGFKCSECGDLLQEEQNGDFIESLKREIENLEEDLREQPEEAVSRFVRPARKKAKPKRAKLRAKVIRKIRKVNGKKKSIGKKEAVKKKKPGRKK